MLIQGPLLYCSYFVYMSFSQILKQNFDFRGIYNCSIKKCLLSQPSEILYTFLFYYWASSLNHSAAIAAAICEPILKVAHHIAIYK